MTAQGLEGRDAAQGGPAVTLCLVQWGIAKTWQGPESSLGHGEPVPREGQKQPLQCGGRVSWPRERLREESCPPPRSPAASKSQLQCAPCELAERPYRTVSSVDVVPIGLVRAITRSPLRL